MFIIKLLSPALIHLRKGFQEGKKGRGFYKASKSDNKGL